MTDIRKAATSLFLDQASGRLARVFGVGQRAAQRWLAETRSAPDDVAEWVGAQEHLLGETRCPERLREAVATALAAGLHPEVVGAHLAAAYREVLGREPE